MYRCYRERRVGIFDDENQFNCLVGQIFPDQWRRLIVPDADACKLFWNLIAVRKSRTGDNDSLRRPHLRLIPNQLVLPRMYTSHETSKQTADHLEFLSEYFVIVDMSTIISGHVYDCQDGRDVRQSVSVGHRGVDELVRYPFEIFDVFIVECLAYLVHDVRADVIELSSHFAT